MDMLLWLLAYLVPPTVMWFCGYSRGKLDGIRETQHFLDEQWHIYENFRDSILHELEVEVDE